MKKLYETITAFILLIMYLRSYRQPIEAPKASVPCKCIKDRTEDLRSEPTAFISCTKHNQVYINNKYIGEVDINISKPKEDMQVYRYPPVTSEQLKEYYKVNPYKFNGFPKDKNLY